MEGTQEFATHAGAADAPTCVLSIDVGRKNLALCCLAPGKDPHGRGDIVRHWVVTSSLPTCDGLAQALRDAGVMTWLPHVKDVVIERQPGQNTPMVRLQCYLEMFFTMCGKFVILQDARHKLSFSAATPFWPAAVPDKWSYYTRKKMAVQTARQWLEATPQAAAMVALFDASSKKDDLADSLLQGMAYAHFVAPLQNAKAEAKRARVPAPRRPNAKQLASGKLSKCHVVSLVLARPGTLDSVATLHGACEEFKPLRKAIVRHFGSLEFCHAALTSWQDRDKQCKGGELQECKAADDDDDHETQGRPPPE